MSKDGDGKARGRPWPKGTSGNPAGRPRSGQALAELLRSELDKAGAAGMTRGARITRKLVELAEGGDVRAIHEVYDRVLGKAPQTFRFGPEFNRLDGLEGITPEDEAEVARQVDELLGPSDGRPRQEPRKQARKTGGV